MTGMKPKTITGRTRKAKAARDKRVADKVRKYVMGVRDESCRVYLDPCAGVFEWAHLGDKQRFKTRGMSPDVRHTSAESCKLCTKHHGMYDRGEIEYECLTDTGADGPMLWDYQRAFQRVR